MLSKLVRFGIALKSIALSKRVSFGAYASLARLAHKHKGTVDVVTDDQETNFSQFGTKIEREGEMI